MTEPTYNKPLVYKDYVIYQSLIMPGLYTYHHKDFDGPEDRRCGWGYTAEECKTEIDERTDEDHSNP